MTVYVTGDIHGGLDMQKLRDWELGDSLTSDDYLIVAGDFGFPWNFSAEECADIVWLESRPYTVLFVDGNHERFDHWAERPVELWHGGLAGSTSLHRGGFGSAHDDALDPLDRLIEDGRCVERSLHAGSGVRVVAVDQAGDGIGLREAKARADVLYGVTGLR